MAVVEHGVVHVAEWLLRRLLRLLRDRRWLSYWDLRNLAFRLWMSRPRSDFLFSDEPDANWDHWAAEKFFDRLRATRRGAIRCLSPSWRSWYSYWVTVGKSPCNVFGFGSPLRFDFTTRLLSQLARDALLPESLAFHEPRAPGSRGWIQIGTDRLEVTALSGAGTDRKNAECHPALVVVAKGLTAKDEFGVDRKVDRVVLLMGLTGPATMAAAHAYFNCPLQFEPRRDPPGSIAALTSVLTATVAVEEPVSQPNDHCSPTQGEHIVDFRYVVDKSVRVTGQVAMSGCAGPVQAPPKDGKCGTARLSLPRGYQPSWWPLGVPVSRKGICTGKRWRVLWGWKRDSESGDKSRIVYLSAHLAYDGKALGCVDPYFYLYSKADPDEIQEVYRHLDKVVEQVRRDRHRATADRRSSREVQLTIGIPRYSDAELLGKLSMRIRDDPPSTPFRPAPCDCNVLRDCTPFDLYAGSGLSYEAGVPRLPELHKAFGVDDPESGRFLFGREDTLPERLACDFDGTLKDLLDVDLKYINGEPSDCHRWLKALQRVGLLKRVFSDNIDDLLPLAEVEEVIQTRGCGVLNEEFNVLNGPEENRLSSVRTAPYLWVVGVSADRRRIIAQARKLVENGRKKTIVVINPLERVSPRSKNVDYLQEGDVFVQKKFSEVRAALAGKL